MQHFQVARLAAPAAVLLAQLDLLGMGHELPASDLLLQNPALLMRALDALHTSSATAAVATPALRLSALDPQWLEALLRRSALQLALEDGAQSHAFLVRHWQLSRRLALTAAALARASGYQDVANAACCGLLLRAGMLVLEQQQGSAYAAMTANTWQQDLLVSAERESFQLDHLEAGVRLLEGWQLDQFCVDALRYQALPLAQVLDAAPLVKICWLANLLAAPDPADASMHNAARELLGVTAADLDALLATLAQALTDESAALGLPLLPVAPTAKQLAEIGQESEQKLRQLRQEIITDNMLAQYAGSRTDSPASLQALLARVLQDAGIEPVFLVLLPAADGSMLEVWASNRVQADPAGLRLVCAEGRNALSSAILGGDASVLTKASPELTVIDRQLLALLGGQGLLCETVASAKGPAVLLLGLDAAAVSAYLGRHALRRCIRRALLDASDAGAASSVPVSTLLYQLRVREAVHEANNPLAIIKNYLHILSLKSEGAEVGDEIQLIDKEIDRVATILGNLRQPEAAAGAPRRLDLNKVVTAMHRMFASAFGDIDMRLQLAAGEALVLADENALKQILTNLVKNAVEAIDTGGSIAISTRTNVYLHDRFFVQLSVSDNGSGIAPDLMQNLFKAGTTTKGGTHTGSGLGIVKRLVEEMHGQISFQSDSKGTAIDILLPRFH
jgi:signal transduction histidine kinase